MKPENSMNPEEGEFGPDPGREPGPVPAEQTLPPRRLWRAWWAWLIIIGLAGAIVWAREAFPSEDKKESKSRFDLRLYQVQAQSLVGAQTILQESGFYEAAGPLRRGDVSHRLRFVVLAGELAGPKEAREQLHLLQRDLAQYQPPTTAEEQRLRDLLERLYRDYARLWLNGPSISAEERQFLRRQLSWFGDLALAPAGVPLGPDKIAVAGSAPALFFFQAQTPDGPAREEALESARQVFVGFVGVFTVFLVLSCAGLAGLLVFVSLAGSGKIRTGLPTGSAHGSIYAETFAVWMILYWGLSFLFSFVTLPGPALLRSSLSMVLSLAALAWPVLRGVPWRQMQRDIGWTWGENPLLEALLGIGCYLMALPMVVVGLIITLLLMGLQRSVGGEAADPFAGPGMPAHPIFERLAQGNLEAYLAIIFLVSVAAPIVEETMFRGVLYRQLREASATLGRVMSFLISAGVVSFLFAAIHPQGLLAIPLLMALAFGFSLAREWRGSLVSAMVAHGLNNGLVVWFAYWALG